MAQAKLSLVDNTQKCIYPPSYSCANPRKYKLNEIDQYYLTTSYADHSGHRSHLTRNTYNVIQPPLNWDILHKQRKEMRSIYAQTHPKRTFVAPTINFDTLCESTCNIDDDLDGEEYGEWEIGCCLVIGAKMNDKFTINCTVDSCCTRFHSSCLWKMFGYKKADINRIASLVKNGKYDGWICPLHSEIECKQNDAVDVDVDGDDDEEVEESDNDTDSDDNHNKPATRRRRRSRKSKNVEAEKSEDEDNDINMNEKNKSVSHKRTRRGRRKK